MNKRFFLATLLLAGAVHAATLPYDDSADAKAAVRSALAAAKARHGKVLLIFGANWCGDCRALDKALRTDRNARLVSGEFTVVKVDVGRFNRNLDVAEAYGDPIRKGIPAAVIVSGDNRVVYATRAGELANARRMSDGDIYAVFANATAASGELH